MGRARFASEEGAPNEDRPDPPPANQMMNWLFKYYVTALPGGSAPPPSKAGLDANKNGVDAKSKHGVNAKRGKISLSGANGSLIYGSLTLT